MFRKLICIHSDTFIRTSGNRLYTECSACGHESAGIEAGTFRYHPDVYSRLQHNRAVRQGLLGELKSWVSLVRERPSAFKHVLACFTAASRTPPWLLSEWGCRGLAQGVMWRHSSKMFHHPQIAADGRGRNGHVFPLVRGDGPTGLEVLHLPEWAGISGQIHIQESG